MLRRSFVLLVLLMALLWQALAMSRIGSSVDVLGDLAHAALHWQGQSHHHQDDGSYQLDDSRDAVQHVAGDQWTSTTGWPAHASTAGATLSQPTPADGYQPGWPEPPLDGPLRPPRPRA